ncbi:hypothetical protein PHET_11056 [Paragonimus heterotremus]|uniref:Uncharacterized protein n=1 Tax=Paragonimus heterotremus TaxID=100268 RepID=A0A8J4SIR1_9TREM|nr:hypothetical protein PHET_11056 [Paragonimus heterotremus]
MLSLTRFCVPRETTHTRRSAPVWYSNSNPYHSIVGKRSSRRTLIVVDSAFTIASCGIPNLICLTRLWICNNQ